MTHVLIRQGAFGQTYTKRAPCPDTDTAVWQWSQRLRWWPRIVGSHQKLWRGKDLLLEPSDFLILDFQSLELWENNFCKSNLVYGILLWQPRLTIHLEILLLVIWEIPGFNSSLLWIYSWGCFLTPTKSLILYIPVGCSVIRFNSDTLYLELPTDSPSYRGLVLQTAPIADASCKWQANHTSDQLVINQCSHDPFSGSVIC